MSTKITTPAGRIVWGHPCEAREKTQKNQATGKFEPVLKDGVKVMQWTFGLAIPRADFEAHVWPAFAAEAATGYPGGTVPPKFSWKFRDCDTAIDDNGKPYSARDGHAGCYLVTVSTELKCPEVFKFNGTGYDQLPGDAIKCGDWIQVGLDLKANVPADRTMTPGMFVNPTVIQFVAYDTRIVPQGAVNPADVFGNRAPALPPGTSATPVGDANAPGMPGQMPPPAMPPMAAAPPAMPPMAAAPPAMPAISRPVDPSHIHAPGTAGEMWWINGAWQPAATTMPPPAPDFVNNAGMPGQMPPR